MDQPPSSVDAAPHPVVCPPRPLVEGTKVVDLNAGELLPCQISFEVQEAAGVGADLHEVDALVDGGGRGKQAPLGNMQ